MKNIDLIYKIVWSFHHTTGLEWDDLFQEASLAYLEALNNYDPERGKITTYLWHCISSRLKDYIRIEMKYREALVPIEKSEACNYPTPNYSFFDRLSTQGQKIVDVILSCPDEFDCKSPENAKDQIANKLKDKGFTWKSIWVGMKDLKLAFSD